MFFGEKLQSVRELKGLSRKELAELIDVSEQAIWQYENEYTVPKFEVVNQFKHIFSVKPQFFYTESFVEKITDTEHVAYRAIDREQRKKTKMETTFVDYINYFAMQLERQINTLPGNILSIREHAEKIYYQQHMTDKNIILNKIADLARKMLDLEENKDLLYRLEYSGIFVVEKNMGATIDAYSTWTSEDRAFIVLGNVKKSAVRRNFDLAHELGHLLMHRHIDMDILTKDELKKIEKEANDFASFLLLPEEAFIADFQQIKRKSNPKYYLELKMKYMVSIVALEYRAYKLDLLSYQENRYFFAALNRENMRINEPLDEDIAIIKPGKLRALFNFVFEKRVLILAEFLNEYHIESKFLEMLFGMEEKFLDKFMDEARDDYYSANNLVQFIK